MSALNAFMTTWAQARATFGAGAPAEGAQFDQSNTLHKLQSDVASAAPGSNWTGSAADEYAEANSRQARTLGRVGDLDKRLGAEVDRSAAVVAAGRRDLDAVKQWVSDAAATVPNTSAGQRMLWPIVSKGSSQIQEIINRSNDDLNSIAGRIRGLGGEYQALGEEEGKGGEKLDKEPTPKTPNTTLDLDDIKRQDPGALGPSGHVEIGPGTWIPENNHPGVEPSPPKAALDYRDIEYRGPYNPTDPSTFGPRGSIELVPGSGAWVPDPNAPGFVPHPPDVPVDMATAKILRPGELAEAGMIPIYPGARMTIPDPDGGAPR